MAQTTRQLIIDAYYLSGLVARGLQSVSGEQLDDGLNRLNAFLAMKGANTRMIPYYQEVEGNFVAGQEKYFIPNLVAVETFAFFLEDGNGKSVRYSLREVSRDEFFGWPRAENVQTLPFQWHLERVKGGANLYVYFTPDKPYPYLLTGKYRYDTLSLNQLLDNIFDDFYKDYLLYGLADYICKYYSVETPMSVKEQLREFENYLNDLSPMDLSLRKIEFFPDNTALNYGDVNIGRGWRPN